MRLRRCVVVGGAGAVGAMFAGLLAAAGADVSIMDTRGSQPVDITDLDQAAADALGGADLVLLAVPERVALAGVKAVTGALRPEAVLADTLSVKGRFVAAVRDVAPGLETVSLNPMFAPTLGIEGRPVAAVVVHDGPGVRELLGLIEAWGGRVRLVGAEEHDRLTGTAQALTHAAVLAFGLALTELDADLTALRAVAPPPHTLLLALLARIVSGAPEVYREAQANPHAAPAREALAAGLRHLAALVEDERGFADAFGEIRDFFGAHLGHYRDLCADIFERYPS